MLPRITSQKDSLPTNFYLRLWFLVDPKAWHISPKYLNHSTHDASLFFLNLLLLVFYLIFKKHSNYFHKISEYHLVLSKCICKVTLSWFPSKPVFYLAFPNSINGTSIHQYKTAQLGALAVPHCPSHPKSWRFFSINISQILAFTLPPFPFL